MPKKSRVKKTLATIVVSVAFTILLIATSTPPPPGVTPPPTPMVNHYQIGDAIQWGNMEVTVLGMERTSEYNDLRLRLGHEFIVVNVEFKNTGDTELPFPYNPNHFYLMLNDRSVYREDMFLDIDIPYEKFLFPKGEKAKGTYVYSIQKGNTGLFFRFDFLEDGKAVQALVALDE